MNVLVAGRFAVAFDCAATRTGESAPGQTGGTARTPCSPGCWAGLLGRSALYGVLAEVEGLGDEAGEQSSSDPGDSPVFEILVREITGTR